MGKWVCPFVNSWPIQGRSNGRPGCRATQVMPRRLAFLPGSSNSLRGYEWDTCTTEWLGTFLRWRFPHYLLWRRRRTMLSVRINSHIYLVPVVLPLVHPMAPVRL